MATNSDSPINLTEDGNELPCNTQGPAINSQGRKLKSFVWQHMDRQPLPDGSVKATCNHCKGTFNANSSSGTSHLKRHIEKCPKRMNHDIKNFCISTSPSSGDTRKMSLRNPNINFEEVRKAISVFVVAGAHSFATCEEPGFKYMVLVMCPQFNTISRHTLRRDVFKYYNDEKKIIMDDLKRAPGRICFTTDNWKSEHTQDEYMCITAHWVDANWILQKRIIKFGALNPHFDGVSLADEIASCLGQWKIDCKVFGFTVDNASYNDSMISSLRNYLQKKKCLVFGGEFFHCRCACHITNLVVQAELKLIDDVVIKIRSIIKHFRHSIPKKKKFYSVAETNFGIKTNKKLRGDHCIRWNSTFLMLDRFIYYRSVVDHVVNRDKDIKIFSLSDDDWNKVSELHSFLKLFYDVTNMFSASKNPTANLYVDGVWRMHRKLIEVVEDSSCKLSSMCIDMQKKFDKYWSDYNILLSCAAVLDPRFKLERVEYCYEKLYGETYAKEMVSQIKTTLFNLFDEYKDDSCGATSPAFATSWGRTNVYDDVGCNEGQMDDLLEYKLFLSRKRKMDNDKSELELYLEEKNYDVTGKCDVLDYWSRSSIRYPNLSCMARDIFTIPISTVPSESAFSMGKKLINPWRASLGEKTIETLACYEDWLRAKGLTLGSVIGEEDDVGIEVDEDSFIIE